MSLMKFVSPAKSDTKVNITIYEPTSDKRGYPITIEEMLGGKPLPLKYARAYLTGEGENTFFSISGPIRKLDDNDIPLTKAKVKDDNYVTEDGTITNEGLADRVSIYMINNENQKLVYSDLGTINIENTKKDKTPTKFTLGSIKLFSDKEALSIAKLNYVLSQKNSQLKSNFENRVGLEHDISLIKEEIKEMQKTSGVKQNVFIQDKTNFLTSLGFKVREKQYNKEDDRGMSC